MGVVGVVALTTTSGAQGDGDERGGADDHSGRPGRGWAGLWR